MSWESANGNVYFQEVWDHRSTQALHRGQKFPFSKAHSVRRPAMLDCMAKESHNSETQDCTFRKNKDFLKPFIRSLTSTFFKKLQHQSLVNARIIKFQPLDINSLLTKPESLVPAGSQALLEPVEDLEIFSVSGVCLGLFLYFDISSFKSLTSSYKSIYLTPHV